MKNFAPSWLYLQGYETCLRLSACLPKTYKYGFCEQ